jgi:hypothetical protein
MGKMADRIKSNEAAKRTGFTTPAERLKALREEGVGTPAQTRTMSVAGQVVKKPVPMRYQLEDWQIDEAHTKPKYIVVDHPVLGEVAVAFPNFIVHRSMARMMFDGLHVLGAGFYALHPDGSVSVYGRSESLDIDSRKGVDDPLVERALGFV